MKALYLIIAILGIYATTSFADAPLTSAAGEYVSELWRKYGIWLNKTANERRQEARERARVVSKGATPVVSIRRTGIVLYGDPYFADGILFNGQRITINDPPSRGPEVFGSEFRIYQNYYVWDNLGIAMHIETPSYGPRAKKDVINNISIHLNPTDEGAMKKSMDPLQNFTGYLELDGAGIDRDSKIWEIRALADRTGLAGMHVYITCNDKRPICKVPSYIPSHSKERSDEVYFWTDMDHDNGKIYTVNYTFKP